MSDLRLFSYWPFSRRAQPVVLLSPWGWFCLISVGGGVPFLFQRGQLLFVILAAILIAVVVTDVVMLAHQARGMPSPFFQPPSPTYAGQPLSLMVTLLAKRATATFAQVRVLKHTFTSTWLINGKSAQVPLLDLPTPPRGRYTWPALEVKLWSGLGLFTARLTWVAADESRPLRIWPARLTEPAPPWPTALHDGTDSKSVVTRTRGQSADEVELREWRPGDRWAHIAQKASARQDRWLTQTPLMRSPVLTRWLDWPSALTAAQGDPERALSILGHWAEWGLAEGWAVGVHGADFALTPATGQAQLLRILDHLSESQP